MFFVQGSVPQMSVISVTVQPGGSDGLRIGTPQRLFPFVGLQTTPQFNAWLYAPHPDGQRFLVNVNADTGAPIINVVTNWQKAAQGAGKE